MDDEELENYVYDEMIYSTKLYEVLSKKDKIKPVDFYDISLKEPYGSSVSGNYHEYLSFLPFFKTFLMRIFPVASPEEFQHYYGLNVEQMMDLHLRGRVQFLLEKDPIDYPYPTFLDPILITKPPIISYRQTAYLSALNNFWLQDLNEGNLLYHGTDKCELYASEYAAFKTFGYESIVDLLQKIAIHDLSSSRYREMSGIIGKIYASFLLRPYDIALDGLSITKTVDRDLFLQLQSISQRPQTPTGRLDFSPRSVISMDIDVGKYLINACEIHLPNDLNTLLKIESEPFQKAYNSLNEAIEQKQENKIQDRTLAMYDAFRESNELIDSMNVQRRNIENFVTYSSVCAGIIGPIAEYITGNPIFGTLASLGVVPHFATPIADRLVKINKADHIVFISDTQKIKNK